MERVIPVDDSVLNAEDLSKIVQFVEYAARNGEEFEKIGNGKEATNPQFDFLRGGDHSDFYQWKLFCRRSGYSSQQISDIVRNFKAYILENCSTMGSLDLTDKDRANVFTMLVRNDGGKQSIQQLRNFATERPHSIIAIGRIFLAYVKTLSPSRFPHVLHTLYALNDIIFHSSELTMYGAYTSVVDECKRMPVDFVQTVWPSLMGTMVKCATLASNTDNPTNTVKIHKLAELWQLKGYLSAAQLTEITQAMTAAAVGDCNHDNSIRNTFEGTDVAPLVSPFCPASILLQPQPKPPLPPPPQPIRSSGTSTEPSTISSFLPGLRPPPGPTPPPHPPPPPPFPVSHRDSQVAVPPSVMASIPAIPAPVYPHHNDTLYPSVARGLPSGVMYGHPHIPLPPPPPPPSIDLLSVSVGSLANLAKTSRRLGHRPYRPLDMSVLAQSTTPYVEPGRLEARVADFYSKLSLLLHPEATETAALDNLVSSIGRKDQHSEYRGERGRVRTRDREGEGEDEEGYYSGRRDRNLHHQSYLAACKQARIQALQEQEQEQEQQLARESDDIVLSSDNIGHAMLAGLGWEQGRGLGAAGAGMKAPIQAVAKKGKGGIGSMM